MSRAHVVCTTLVFIVCMGLDAYATLWRDSDGYDTQLSIIFIVWLVSLFISVAQDE